MHRSLAYFWRINLAVLLGVAIATAVLTGALIVGDSVRESLRHLVLHRLGGIDYALISTSWFNTMSEGGSVESHRHERSVISGAYYPYADDGSNPLMLESPIQQLRMNDCIIKVTGFNRYTEHVPALPGSLVLFPSWLKHYVEPNNSKKRYVISFNTIRHADRGYIKTVKDYRIEKHESKNT